MQNKVSEPILRTGRITHFTLYRHSIASDAPCVHQWELELIGRSQNVRVNTRPNPHVSMRTVCSPGVGARGNSGTGTAPTAGTCSPANAKMTNAEASTDASERRDSIVSSDLWFSRFRKDVFGASAYVELNSVRRMVLLGPLIPLYSAYFPLPLQIWRCTVLRPGRSCRTRTCCAGGQVVRNINGMPLQGARGVLSRQLQRTLTPTPAVSREA